MKYTVFWLALLSDAAVGHYVFNKISIDGVVGEEYQYIRKNSNGIHPVQDMDNISLRCNVDGHVPGDDVQTARVEAGSTISWIVEPYVYHPGPISFFMTKVHDANRASGSTEWFKVHDIGPQFTPKGGDWSATQQQAFDVTIPPCLASGEYLMRIQQVGVHVPGKAPQFHISCAQLRVFGSGTELPPAKYMVNIPGVFKRDDPGFTQNIYLNFKEYTIPGGDVWACEK